jgi:glycosyltransferase involved in cell wall biosynthesis
MITLAITTHNRAEMTVKAFEKVLDDTRISEILIVDDCSRLDQFVSLQSKVISMDKVRVIRNVNNLGCYHNKRKAVEESKNDWVILLDSDNVIDKTYLDSMFEYEWVDNVIYAPEFARPHFDYRKFSDKKIEKTNVRSLSRVPMFDCLINTCNYLVNRDYYLNVWQDHKEPWTADTLFHNYNHIKSGGTLFVVPRMQYDHLVHDGSHYKEHVNKTGNMSNDYLNKLINL